MPEKVYVLTIEHRHGRDVTGVFEDEDDAVSALYAYVDDQWEDEVIRHDLVESYGGGPGEFTQDDAIKIYFEVIVDDEFYDIQKAYYVAKRPQPIEVQVADEPSDHVARFQPQVWSHNYAIDVDPEGETDWTVSQYWLDHIKRGFPANWQEKLYESSDVSDMVRYDPSAPQWVREWQGPHYVNVYKKENDNGSE